jgi:hypothetical protein
MMKKKANALKKKKKKQKETLLVSDKRAKGSKCTSFKRISFLVYDRFYNPLCPFQRDLRTRSATPGVGSYFRSCAPVRV